MVTNNSTNSPTTNTTVIAGNGTGYTAIPYSATPSTSSMVYRDSNGNSSSNNFNTSATAVTSAGGTTVLTAASAKTQVLQGSANQTFQLPNATTLVIGWSFNFNNNSTGILTVVDAASGAVCTIPSGGFAQVFTISVSTSAGAWDKHFLIPANGSYGTAGLTVTGNINSSALTASAPVIADASKNLTSTALTNGQLLIGNTGSVPTAATLTAGSGVQITNGAGSITIAASGASGQVIQQIRSTNSTASSIGNVMPNTSTTPSTTYGGEILTATITPTNSSSIILIQGSVAIFSNAANEGCLYLIVNNTGNATFVQPITWAATNLGGPYPFQVYFTAGTTSSTQYAIWGSSASGTGIRVNSSTGSTVYGGCVSTMTITELNA